MALSSLPWWAVMLKVSSSAGEVAAEEGTSARRLDDGVVNSLRICPYWLKSPHWIGRTIFCSQIWVSLRAESCLFNQTLHCWLILTRQRFKPRC